MVNGYTNRICGIDLYVVKQKCTTANIVIYSEISLFYYQKDSVLYNSLIISTYKIEERKRVTIWLLLKFPGLP